MRAVAAGRIPVAGPWITERETRYAADAAATNWYGQANDYISRFEAAFSSAVQRAFAVSLPSCTSALHLALLALGIGRGHEVIVPDITWIASAAPISYVGADPVFVDVEPDTWCLSARAMREAITPRTRAVIPVDLYGGMPDYGEIDQLAAEHGIAVIEDAAEAIGSMFAGRPAGSFGLASVFSFHGSKTVTTGEGGMLVTDDTALYERVRVLRDHGRQPGDRFFRNTEVGYKYKMSAVQAAIGLAQLERLDELVERKRAIFREYERRLRGRVVLNTEPAGTRNSYWMVTAVLDAAQPLRTPELMSRLDEAGVDSRPFFHPLSSLPAYADAPSADSARARNSTSYSLSSRGINLPSALCLSERDVDRVCSLLLSLVGGTG